MLLEQKFIYLKSVQLQLAGVGVRWPNSRILLCGTFGPILRLSEDFRVLVSVDGLWYAIEHNSKSDNFPNWQTIGIYSVTDIVGAICKLASPENPLYPGLKQNLFAMVQDLTQEDYDFFDQLNR